MENSEYKTSEPLEVKPVSMDVLDATLTITGVFPERKDSEGAQIDIFKDETCENAYPPSSELYSNVDFDGNKLEVRKLHELKEVIYVVVHATTEEKPKASYPY